MIVPTIDACLTLDQIMTALDDFSEGFFVLDEGLCLRYLNAAAEKTLSCRREEILGRSFHEAFPLARSSVFEDAFSLCLAKNEALDFQTFFGIGTEAKWYDVRVSPGDAGISIRLRELGRGGDASELEGFRRELSHRVKNSLAFIASLASVESEGIVDEGARASLDRLQGRIHATGLLYDKLSSSSSANVMDAADYLEELVSLIAANFSGPSGRVKIELRLSSLILDSRRAVALGLAANEAMTNSFKYGLAGAKSGRLRVELSARGGMAVFAVEDDGPGFPSGFDPLTDGDIGFALMAEKARELGGRIETMAGSGGRGARVQISFPS